MSSRIKHIEWNNIGMAFLWTLFISFFTYTSCWVALVSVKVSFNTLGSKIGVEHYVFAHSYYFISKIF